MNGEQQVQRANAIVAMRADVKQMVEDLEKTIVETFTTEVECRTNADTEIVGAIDALRLDLSQRIDSKCSYITVNLANEQRHYVDWVHGDVKRRVIGWEYIANEKGFRGFVRRVMWILVGSR